MLSCWYRYRRERRHHPLVQRSGPGHRRRSPSPGPGAFLRSHDRSEGGTSST
nr:MAG TPA: hypothetical protein [Caudoviricetes sp.]